MHCCEHSCPDAFWCRGISDRNGALCNALHLPNLRLCNVYPKCIPDLDLVQGCTVLHLCEHKCHNAVWRPGISDRKGTFIIQCTEFSSRVGGDFFRGGGAQSASSKTGVKTQRAAEKGGQNV